MHGWLPDYLDHLREKLRRERDIRLAWTSRDDMLELRLDSYSYSGQPIFLRFDLISLQSSDVWLRIDSDVYRSISQQCGRSRYREPRTPNHYWITDELGPASERNLSATEVMHRQQEFINARRQGYWGEPTPAKPNPADVKAEELLVSKLFKEQKKEWLAGKYFMATGNTTGIQYKLTTNRTYGIETYLYGKKIGKICVVAKDGKIPICDQLLAQKLLIETDEEAFIKLANVSA